MNSKKKHIKKLAQAHNLSPEAVEHVWQAIVQGRGTMAQFNHPELGGMGQWQAGGMVMVGDMFNHRLKATVDDLCRALS
ncbi:MAG: SHOCT domain-containing protein, partial [Anaerolineae bacterium]|nr:SHOCT domain-containing protein [Anaerolineae bacterium]